MTDAFLVVDPDNPEGPKLQTYRNTVAGNVVDAEAVVEVDEFGRPLRAVVASAIGVNSFDTSQGSPIPTNAAPWVGTFEDVSDFVEQAIILKIVAASTVRGMIQFSYKRDANTTIIPIDNLPIVADDGAVFIPVPLLNVGPLVKVSFIPDAGGPAITAAAMTVLNYRRAGPPLTRFQTQVVGPGEPMHIVRALVEPSLVGERGLLGADRSIAGEAIVGNRISRIALYSHKPLANNRLVTTGTIGAGAAVVQDPDKAEFKLTVNAAVASTARMTSIVVNRYHTNREWYFTFPVRFTAGVTGVSQRCGGFDASNGFFLEERAGVFGFTVRKTPPSTGITTDSFVPLSAANGDPLDATFMSRFARGSRLELYNKTKKNVWRIRAVLHGSSLQFFDLISPDGLWMRVNSNRFPNLQEDASILNWDLPFRAEVTSLGTGSGIIDMGIGSVDGGWVGAAAGLEPSDQDSREHWTVSIVNDAASGLKGSQPAGTVFVVKSIVMTAQTTSGSGVIVRLRDGGAAGPVIMPARIQGASGLVLGTTNVQTTFPEGRRVAGGIYLETPASTPVDAEIVGYLTAA